MIVALATGWVVPGTVHKAALAERDTRYQQAIEERDKRLLEMSAQLQVLRERSGTGLDRNDRLLTILEGIATGKIAKGP